MDATVQREELRTYWIKICVELFSEIGPAPDDADEDRRPIVGYFRNYGVTAGSERRACDLVATEITDGAIAWSESRVSCDVMARLAPAIIARAGDWSQEGVWFRSGRIFFTEED
jgi:hypothetical protein